MSTAFIDMVNHVIKSVEQPPAESLAAFTQYRSGMFRSVDRTPGSRLPLEEMVGQSRVFEIDIQNRETEEVRLGGVAPLGYTDTLSVLIRYEAAGRHDRMQVLSELVTDQQFVVDALMRSNWPSVTGLVSLMATAGNIERFELGDAQGNAVFEGYIIEVVIAASYDI